MKVFVSWSGALSGIIAENLRMWLPGVIQSTKVFFSPDDIEKGENWDNKISTELAECDYGIICLTPENVSAPWINFEAGAIAKSLDSRVASLLINIKPSDIKGPLARYQATQIDKQDVLKLLQTINRASDNPIDNGILENTFSAMWPQFNQSVMKAMGTNPKAKAGKVKDDPMEEMLQLLRNIDSIVSSPEELFPVEYFDYIQRNRTEYNGVETMQTQQSMLTGFVAWLSDGFDNCFNDKNDIYTFELVHQLRFDILFAKLKHFAMIASLNPESKTYREIIRLRERCYKLARNMEPVVTKPYDE